MCKTEKGMAGKGRAGQICARQGRGWQENGDREITGKKVIPAPIY
jgi:hypothetical protein